MSSPPMSPLLNTKKYLTNVDQVRKSCNFETWINNIKLKKILASVDYRTAEKKLRIVDDELADAIFFNKITLPDVAMTTTVKKVMNDEDKREPVSPSNILVKCENVQRDEYKVNLCCAIRHGQMECLECLTGVGSCEWDGPMGDLLRARGKLIRLNHPHLPNNQLRFQLYQFYIVKRFGRELDQLKKEKKNPRIALPFCVEKEIKKMYSGPKSVDYVWFQNRVPDDPEEKGEE
jgi:hypothetical protein